MVSGMGGGDFFKAPSVMRPKHKTRSLQHRALPPSFLDGKGATKTLPSKRHQETEDSQHLPAYKFFQHQLPYTTTCPRNRPRLNPKQKQEVRVRSEGQGRIGTALRLATDAANLDISLAIAQMKKLPAK